MNRKDAQRAAHAVIDHLASLERPLSPPEDPVAWRKGVRNRIRTQRWETLMAALSDDHAKAASGLIALIAPASPAAKTGPEAMAAARSGEWERNERRLRGEPPLCRRCDDGGVWFDDDGGHPCECGTPRRPM